MSETTDPVLVAARACVEAEHVGVPDPHDCKPAYLCAHDLATFARAQRAAVLEDAARDVALTSMRNWLRRRAEEERQR
jgi:hypothetical protein